MANYHLAQINIARLIAPFDDELIRPFRDGLAPMNALAERSAGFIWRFTTPAGDASLLTDFPDPLIIVNMSVWQDADSLWAYAYDSAHTDYFRERRAWFSKLETPPLALWWVVAGHTPGLAEGKEKLALLAANGPSPAAFTLKQQFPPPSA
jgi:hypothetical protein